MFNWFKFSSLGYYLWNKKCYFEQCSWCFEASHSVFHPVTMRLLEKIYVTTREYYWKKGQITPLRLCRKCWNKEDLKEAIRRFENGTIHEVDDEWPFLNVKERRINKCQ